MASMALPPGPREPALIQSVRFWRRPIDALVKWHRRYGDVFTVHFAIVGTGVYVADPQAVREMFTGDQSDLHAGEANEPVAPVLGDHSVLVLDGPEHLRQRKLLLPPFQGSAVKRFRDVIREVAEAEVDAWEPGARFPIRDRMRSLTFAVICRAVFGMAERERIARLEEAMKAVADGAWTIYTPRWLRRDVGRLSPWGVLQRRLRRFDALIYEEIERRRREHDLDERTDVLSLLLQARDEEGRPMSDIELRDELMTMLAAGHETTATGLAFAFDLLLHHPRELRRLRDELDGGDESYADAVATETLRLRPVIDAAERTLKAPRTIAGWDLPAGVKVYPAIGLIHRREDIYPRAEEFLPERFVGGRAESYTWIPFGGGIRRCIGAALAQAEMSEVLKVVVPRTDLRALRPRPDPGVLRGVTVSPKYGVPVEVVARRPPAGTRSEPETVAA
jgi:cytochrome P450